MIMLVFSIVFPQLFMGKASPNLNPSPSPRPHPNPNRNPNPSPSPNPNPNQLYECSDSTVTRRAHCVGNYSVVTTMGGEEELVPRKS